MTISAKVIADSITPWGQRVTTFELEVHRYVLAEQNTHRLLSRNAQSSRAVPVERMIELIKEDTAMPICSRFIMFIVFLNGIIKS